MTENGAIAWANERRKLRDLIPWDHNPREINEREAERLGDSLAEFGQIQTIAIGPDNEVYDGHQRKLVWSILPQFGRDYEVDVRVSSRPLTEHERQKLVVYLHKGTTGEWDWTELANSFELSDLTEWGFEEGELIGWPQEEPAEDPGAQLDKAAELQEKWGVVRGDIWFIESVATPGKFHRVMCGDSTSAEDVGRLMGGERAGMVFTDPPYNVAYGSNQAPICGRNVQQIENDDMSAEDWQRFLAEWLECTLSVLDGAIYVCMSAKEWATVRLAFEAAGGHWSSDIIWAKDRLVPGRKNYHSRYEALLYGWVEGQKHHWCGVTNKDDVWEIDRHSVNELHPTQKPVGLVARAIGDACPVQGLVFDPFLGSGTTIVAAESVGRVAFGCEIEPKYVSVTLERLAGLGLEPQRVTQ